MKYIYIDNFRGFEDTFIPIKSINFLVGENSTGKTSVLSLIKLMNTFQFWLSPAFDIEGINLGHFNDIVSINSSDRSYFRIGIIDIKKERKENIFISYLMTFKSVEGRPRISAFSFNHKNISYTLKIMPNNILYTTNEFSQNNDGESFVNNVFLNWIIEHTNKDTSFYLKLKDVSRRNGIDLFSLIAVIENSISGKAGFEKILSYFPDIERVLWVAPIRTKPRRTYDDFKTSFSPEGEHTPYIIKKMISRKKSAIKFFSFLNNIGKSSNLFETLAIRKYGKRLTDPFELDIVLNKNPISIEFVGYGVSQSLPLIVDFLVAPKDTCFLVQQPEVHLHPKAQAAIGEVIHNLADSENKKFIIETHSDYLIDRFRITQRKSNSDIESQILYFERDSKGNHIHQINISKEGNLPQDQPAGYRTFFIKEQMELLGL